MIIHKNVTKFKSVFLILVIAVFSMAMLGGETLGKSHKPGKPPKGNFEAPILTIEKTMISGEEKVPIKTEVFWELEIVVENLDDAELTDVVVTDEFPAEIAFVNSTPSGGVVVEFDGSNASATDMTWTIGTMAPETTATLTMWIKTNKNPAGKQRFTKAGKYKLNYGASVEAEHPTLGTIEAGPTDKITVRATKK